MEAKFTPGPWDFSLWDEFGERRFYITQEERAPYTPNYSDVATLIDETVSGERASIQEANARLIAAAPELLEALREGRRAIGDHHAPNDCYATGPMTGNDYRDLVQCPACSFIAMYDAAIAKATGEQA